MKVTEMHRTDAYMDGFTVPPSRSSKLMHAWIYCHAKAKIIQTGKVIPQKLCNSKANSQLILYS